MKKYLAILLAAVMLLAMAACGGGDKPVNSTDPVNSTEPSPSSEPTAESITIKLGHNSNGESMYNQGCEEFARLVSEYTGGTVTIEIHNSGTLGDEAELLDGVRMGTVDMALINSSQLATYCSKFSVLSLPFLFEDYDHVEAVVTNDEICDILTADALENGNVRLLMPFWADGFRHYVNNIREVATPDDLAGLKLRVPAWEALIAATEEFGAAPLTMPFTEAYTGVSSGTVDGMEGVSWSVVANGLQEVCKYMTLDGHVYSPSVLIMNTDLYDNKLSEDQLAAVVKAAEEAGTWQTNLVKDSEQSDLQTLRDAGMVITEVDKDVWVEAAQPVYDKYKDIYDQDLIALITSLK